MASARIPSNEPPAIAAAGAAVAVRPDQDQKETKAEFVFQEITHPETIKLFAAVEANKFDEAQLAVLAGAEVNRLGRIPHIDKVNYYTPLQGAVAHLNYDLVLFLLTHLADPNLLSSNGASTIEILFVVTQDLAVKQLLGKKEQQTPDFFKAIHLDVKISRPVQLTQNHLETATTIFDLLICFGHNHTPSWTQPYLDSVKELQEAVQYQQQSAERRVKAVAFLSPEVIDEALEMKVQGSSSIKQFFVRGAARITFWAMRTVTNHRLNKSDPDHQLLGALVETQNHLQANLDQTTALVHLEKSNLRRLFFDLIDNGLAKTFPVELVSLIEQFAVDMREEVFKRRQAEIRMVSFWQKPPPIPGFDEEKKKEFINQLLLFAKLDFLDDRLSEAKEDEKTKIKKLIVEYAAEAPKEQVQQVRPG